MKYCFYFLFILWGPLAYCQMDEGSELFLKLKEKDSLLFKEGFNKCQIAKFESFISEDLEFYHDQGGFTTNKNDFIKAIRQNICGNPDKKPIRKLKNNSLQVFPLFDNGELYGAIQKGQHDFYIQPPGKKTYLTSSAKFTHVWLLKNQEWILERVLSYDHISPK